MANVKRPYYQEGKLEGIREERILILLEVLEVKFGAVPGTTLEQIANASPSDLKTWILAASQKDSYEEVFS